MLKTHSGLIVRFLVSSREEATSAYEESRKRKVRGDPTSCEEVEANYNELFAMIVGSLRRHSWRVEAVELKESNKNEISEF